MAMIRQSSVPEMLTQSTDLMTNPSVEKFERYERYGTLGNAAVYVLVAIAISAVLGFVGSFLPGTPRPSVFVVFNTILSGLAQFFIFTGMVYFMGKKLYAGNGTWDEVAYTFSLFIAPLIAIGAVITFIVTLFAWIPFIGALVGLIGLLVSLALMVVQIYYAYLGVQSSMNLRDSTQTLIVLVLSFLASGLIMGIISWLL